MNTQGAKHAMAEKPEQLKHPKPSQPKDIHVGEITLRVKCCYREHKFPEGHPERKCQFGLDKLDMQKCTYCSWYGEVPGLKNVKALTGMHLIKLSAFLQSIKEPKDANKERV